MEAYTIHVGDRRARAAFEARYSQPFPYFVHKIMGHWPWSAKDEDGPVSLLELMRHLGPEIHILVAPETLKARDHANRLQQMEDQNLSFAKWTSFRVEASREDRQRYMKLHVCYAFVRKEDAAIFRLFWQD